MALERIADKLKPARPVLEPLWSLGVWTWSFAWMSGVVVGGIAQMPFAPPQKLNRSWWAPMMGRTVGLTGSRVTITHDEGFDPERPSVFCQNHISVLDGLLASHAIPNSFCGLMKGEHFSIPVYGWVMKLSDGIPVWPRNAGRTAEMTEAAKSRAERGMSILVFPEAHRTTTGQMRPFKRGVFFMARDAGLPVVPMAVHGLYDVNHKGRWQIWPGHIRVHFGAQIETAGLDDEAVGRLAEHVHAQVEAFAQTGTPYDGPEFEG